MKLEAQLTPDDKVGLVISDWDRERLADSVAREVAKHIVLERNLTEIIANKLVDEYLFLVENKIDEKIRDVVNAFSGGNYPHVIFQSETIDVYGEKINAEVHVYKKFESLGYVSYYSKEYAKRAYQGDDRRDTIPREALLCLYEENKTGMPDLFVHRKSSYAFIEVKTNGDSLRPDQMLWIKNHPNITVIIFYLEQRLHTKEENDIINYQLGQKNG